MELYSDDYFMNQAYKEALVALEEGEVPVGAVVVTQNRIIARAYNQTEKLSDTTAHAEMIAITSAAAYLGTKYLKECTLYVTLEPCIMCAGASLWSQLGRVVYGAEDPKKGFMRYGKELLHPKTKLEFGIMSGPCLKLIQDFFEEKRRLQNSTKG
jgi:tRNA(adenine34) deaminase